MNYGKADQIFVDVLKSALDEGIFRSDIVPYSHEPRGRWVGNIGAIVAPRNTADVSKILKLCNLHKVPVIPFGGGTGLVGGQLSDSIEKPLILSLERMNKIRELHAEEYVVVAEAGTVLADIQRSVEDKGLLFPLSLASQGTAQIGGNLATNAGGLNVLRYGNARDLCLGLEVVFADGRIWHGLKRLRKDNTGYDLRNLMIGSEGTLGIITAAALKLVSRPVDHAIAYMMVHTPSDALKLLTLVREQVGEGISAFELMSHQGFDFLSETMPNLRQPFDKIPQWCVLLDIGLSQGQNADAVMETIFSHALRNGIVFDGILAKSQNERDAFWSLREAMPLANKAVGSISSHDISLPLSNLSEFISVAGEEISKLGFFRVNCFGHLGDGNLHYNVFPPKGYNRDDFLSLREQIKHTVHALTHKFDGSISAEHGIGRLKVDDLNTYGDPVKLQLMRQIKTAFDPNLILNPGAILSNSD